MKVIKDSVIYITGDLISRSIPFLLLPYLTRTLGSAGFGELSYYQVIIALGLIFIGFSQDGALVRYYYRYGRSGLGSLIFVGMIQETIVCTLLSLIVLFIFNDVIILYAVWAAYSQSMLALFFGAQQCQRHPINYISIQFLNALVSAGLTVLLFSLFEPGVQYRILAMFIANGTGLAASVFIFYFLQENTIKLSLKLFKKIVFIQYGIWPAIIVTSVKFFCQKARLIDC
jgi:Polysaccharide biosynthesis protein.